MAQGWQKNTGCGNLESSTGVQTNPSILIVGIRGTGKTSLAILAAAALGLGGVVDADHHFVKSTTLSRAEYVSTYGFEKYREKELALMCEILYEHPTQRIIVGGPGFAEGMSSSQLKSATAGHPIIFVMRDPHEIDSALNVCDVAKVSRIQEAAYRHCRSLSSFEFYNLSEPRSAVVSDAPRKHPFLALKHAENDFVRLVHAIWNRDVCQRLLQAHHSTFFLPENNRHSYALTLPIGSIADISCELPQTDLLADAVQLVVPMKGVNGCEYLDQTTATYITRQYYLLRRHVKLPVIFHLDIGNLQPEQPGFWASYASWLCHALRLAPEYITLDLNCELDSAQSILCTRGSTKVIGDCSSSTNDPAAWESPGKIELVRKAEEWGCDLVRISQQCARPEDNRAVQRFVVELERSGGTFLPVIAYNRGPSGRSSCLANAILTPVTHDIIRAAEKAGYATKYSDEMLTVQEAQRALFASFELDHLVFGVFGSTEASSMAPMMHNAAFSFCGMPHEFIKFPSMTLASVKAAIHSPKFGGATVRYPFKQEVISLVDHLSPEAQAIQAVNTLVPMRRDGLESFLLDRNREGPVTAIFGDNTDWIGIYRSVQQNMSPVNAAKRRRSALIIGAGGMARAAVYACLRLDVDHIFIQNRTHAHTEQLLRHFDGKVFPLHKVNTVRAQLDGSSSSGCHSPSGFASSNSSPGPQAGPARVQAIDLLTDPCSAEVEPPTIIISAIPRFTKDGPVLPDSTLHHTWLSSPTGGVAVDLAYNLADTPLLRQISSLNKETWVAVSGLQVLPEQGFAQFELFTGRKAPQHLMRSKLADYLKDHS
ncbi:unnamed protein product [Penicillium salamii]|uniref:Quinate repressor protein n=1 Tax=Penicillium salamii TaxID=1612424 RepID=A0A9W4JK42_9EURO|nr:unnamed protein product [Penicillium salamii]